MGLFERTAMKGLKFKRMDKHIELTNITRTN